MLRILRFAFAATLAGSLAAATSSTAKAADAEIVFYADTDTASSGSGSGHAYVQLVPLIGPQKGQSFTYGFYPNGRYLDQDPGVVQDDKGRIGNNKWLYRIRYPVNADQYNKALTFVNTVGELGNKGKSPYYHLRTQNCVNFIQSVAGQAGIALPAATSNRFAGFQVEDPLKLSESMGDIFSNQNGKFDGGTVEKNAHFVNNAPIRPGISPAFSSTGPRDIGYEELIDATHSTPDIVANYTRTLLNRRPADPFPLAPGGTVQVTLTSVNLPEQIISIDWGDNSPMVGEAASFSHIYTSPGIHMLSLGVNDDSQTALYTFPVDVTASGRKSAGIAAARYSRGIAIIPQSQPACIHANWAADSGAGVRRARGRWRTDPVVEAGCHLTTTSSALSQITLNPTL